VIPLSMTARRWLVHQRTPELRIKVLAVLVGHTKAAPASDR